MTKFSKKEAIQYGWEAMKKNFWFFVVLLIIMGAVNVISRRVQGGVGHTTSSTAFIVFFLWLVFFLLSRIVDMGQIRITLDIFDNQKPEFKNIFNRLDNLLDYIIVAILYGAIVIGGLFLLIVPGVIWMIKYSFAGFLVVDKKMHPVDALKKSSEITEGNRWNLFLFELVSLGIVILGALFFVIGLFVALPTIMMAAVFIYKKLLAQTELSKPQIIELNKI